MTTRTGTHTIVELANPFLYCYTCQQKVTAYHSPSRCCEEGGSVGVFNFPCGHQDGAYSVCRSWSPVDGCTCLQEFGNVPHGPEYGDD